MISREPLPAPKFWLNPEVKDFYDFTPDDVKLEGYETHRRLRIYLSLCKEKKYAGNV